MAVEEAKAPLNKEEQVEMPAPEWIEAASPDCLNYLPEAAEQNQLDEEYARSSSKSKKWSD